MKAVYIEEPGIVKIKEIKAPERKAGEALLKVLYAGICGSDLGSYKGTFTYFDYPRIPGHEFAAEIVEIDENEQGLIPGMVVTCNPFFNCGQCHSCKRGIVNACMDNQTMGCQRDGAFCEYITMPIERIYDGKGLAPEVLAAIEPLCISYHGVQKAGINEGDKVLVIGGGTIGVLAASAAKSLGGEVYLCDIPQASRKLSRSQEIFGFDGTILNEGAESLDKAVKDITGSIDINGKPIADVSKYGIEADIILLGPQVKFQLKKIQAALPEKQVHAIDMRDYGRMNGEGVINFVKEKMGD